MKMERLFIPFPLIVPPQHPISCALLFNHLLRCSFLIFTCPNPLLFIFDFDNLLNTYSTYSIAHFSILIIHTHLTPFILTQNEIFCHPLTQLNLNFILPLLLSSAFEYENCIMYCYSFQSIE